MNSPQANKLDKDSDLAQACGWVGSALAVIFFLVPVFPFINYFKKKIGIKEIPGILISLSVFNCLLWAGYGFKEEQPQMYIPNTIGAIESYIFIVMYWTISAKRNPILIVGYNLIVLSICFLIFGLVFFVCPMRIRNELQVFMIVINILMYGSTLANFYEAITTKNKELIPIWSSGEAVIACTLWTIYGLGIGDKTVVIPNVFGLIANIIGCVLYIWIHITKRQDRMKTSTLPKEDDIDEADLIK